MELGKIYEYVFRKDDSTTYIIDGFENSNCNTLCLCRPFTVYLQSCGAYKVSLYIQRYEGADKPKAYCSLTQLKKKYTEQAFTMENCDDLLVKPIFDYLTDKSYDDVQEDYFYNEPVVIKAKRQYTKAWEEINEVAFYRIVGVRLERF